MELLARLAGCDLRLQRNMCLVSVDESGGVEDCAAIWTLAPKESGCQCSVFSLNIQRNFVGFPLQAKGRKAAPKKKAGGGGAAKKAKKVRCCSHGRLRAHTALLQTHKSASRL